MSPLFLLVVGDRNVEALLRVDLCMLQLWMDQSEGYESTSIAILTCIVLKLSVEAVII